VPRGKSSIQQKSDAARKRMYTPAQYLAYERCGCDAGGFMPSDDMIEKATMLKLPGGFSTAKSNLCTTCREYRSVNGSCGCDL
jgi:hypothetical protein